MKNYTKFLCFLHDANLRNSLPRIFLYPEKMENVYKHMEEFKTVKQIEHIICKIIGYYLEVLVYCCTSWKTHFFCDIQLGKQSARVETHCQFLKVSEDKLKWSWNKITRVK